MGKPNLMATPNRYIYGKEYMKY